MVQTRIDKLLEGTIGQHGFWLINNIEYIRDDLQFLLQWHGGNVKNATAHLNDLSTDFVKKVYAKIDEARQHKTNEEAA